MTTDPDSIQQQLDELRQQLANLESLRALLGDELTDEKAASLESEIEALVQTGGGAFVSGSVSVQQGDFVARDKLEVGELILGDKVETVAPDQAPEVLLDAYLRSLARECERLPTPIPEPSRRRPNQRAPDSPGQGWALYAGGRWGCVV